MDLCQVRISLQYDVLITAFCRMLTTSAACNDKEKIQYIICYCQTQLIDNENVLSFCVTCALLLVLLAGVLCKHICQTVERFVMFVKKVPSSI